MRTVNSWPIEPGYSATFGNDDFERWWLEGRDRSDAVPPEEEQELLDNCLYLAEAESREMTQTLDELRAAIHAWAVDWNAKIALKH